MLALSALTFAAAPYLASRGIPVIGAAQDASEWTTSPNMFSVIGTRDYSKVYSQDGLILKDLGATNVASIGYSISPSSAGAAKAAAISARLAGLKVGYLNANFPFGRTNVAPTALAFKTAGSDGLSASIETNTEFALIDALRQEGINPEGRPGFHRLSQPAVPAQNESLRASISRWAGNPRRCTRPRPKGCRTR